MYTCSSDRLWNCQARASYCRRKKRRRKKRKKRRRGRKGKKEEEKETRGREKRKERELKRVGMCDDRALHHGYNKDF